MKKTSREGIYTNKLANGDITYYAKYLTEFGKQKLRKIGKQSEGITIAYSSKMRAKWISEARLGEDAPLTLKEKKQVPTFNEVSKLLDKVRLSMYDNYLARSIGRLHITELDTKTVDSLFKSLHNEISFHTKRKLSEKTINAIMDSLAILIKKSGYPNIVAEKTKENRNKLDNTRERYLSMDEIQLLIDTILEDKPYHNHKWKPKQNIKDRYELFVKLSLTIGGRRNTILSIQKQDINFETDTIRLRNHKVKRNYTSFIHPSIKKLLLDYTSDLKPTDYLISRNTNQGTYKLILAVQDILNGLFNQGLADENRKDRVVIHSLRHTFASQLALNSTPILTIKNLMDHSDISTTMRYAHLSPDHNKEHLQKMNIFCKV